MKNIRVKLAVLTRVEYSRVISVPDDFSENELDRLVDETYRNTDGGEYLDDPDYWEKGNCYWEAVDDDSEEVHANTILRETTLFAMTEDRKKRVELGTVKSSVMSWPELQQKALDEYWDERLQTAAMCPAFEIEVKH